MPVSRAALASVAKAYTASMTSIRGRRVQRLLLRELASFDAVAPATTAGGRSAVFAVGANGAIAVCCTDGTGRAATVVRGNLAAATLETGYDLHKDSLPVVFWRLRHPALGGDVEPLTVPAGGLSAGQAQEIASLLAQQA